MATNFEASFYQKVMKSVRAGDKFVGEIWISPAVAVGELTDAGMVGTSLELRTKDTDSTATSGPAIPSGWIRITTLHSAQATGDDVTLQLRLRQIGNPAARGDRICVYVDDAALRSTE